MRWSLFISLLFVMTFSGTLGAYFLKRAMGQFDKFNLIRLIFIPSIYLGGFFYLLGAAVNMLLLRSCDYTTIYPLTSLTYIWTMLLSFFVLKEQFDKNKIIALICIIVGAFLIY